MRNPAILNGRSILIGVLILLNLFLAVQLFYITNNSVTSMSNIGKNIKPITISTSILHNINIPNPDKLSTIIYLFNDNDKSLWDYYLLEVISFSSLGKYYDIIIADFIGTMSHGGYTSNKYTSNMFIVDGMRLINLSSLSGYSINNLMILSSMNTIIFDGRINRSFLFYLLMDVALEYKEYSPTCISVGDTLYGQINSIVNNDITSEITDDAVIFLYSTFCMTCEDEDFFNAALSMSHYNTIMIFPDLFICDNINSALSPKININNVYRLNMEKTNISYDDFLISYPVVVIIKDFKIIFISTNRMSVYTILNAINELVGKVNVES